MLKRNEKGQFTSEGMKGNTINSGRKQSQDHIKPFAYYPDLRFELSNGRTLCIDCHKKTDTYFYKISKQKMWNV